MTTEATRVRPSETGTDHPVHVAAERGDVGRVRDLVDTDSTLVHLGDRAGGTPLHRAVIGRAPRVVGLLLDRGADIHAIHGAGLGSASGYAPQDLQPIDLAIWGGPCRVPSLRAIFGSIRDGLHIARLLLERGTDPTWPDSDDSPRGSAAARAGNRPLVERLLAHGADPSANVDSAGNATFAARTPALRALLMDHGGTVDPYDLVWLGEDDLVMQRVRDDPPSAHAGCGGVYTAVCTRGNRKLLMRLLDAGVKMPPVAGGCQSYLLERPDMLRLLLARGGLNANYQTPEGVTLLHALCSRDVRGRTMKHRTECAAILLDAGADTSARDTRYGATPLAWAARNNLPDMVDFLRKHGAT